MQKFWIVILERTKEERIKKSILFIFKKNKGRKNKKVYSVYLKDKDTTKEVLERCYSLYDALMFYTGLKKILGEISVVFEAEDPKGHYFKFGQEVAKNFRNS